MHADLNEMYYRANAVIRSGNSLDNAAKRISSEFHAAAYVSKGKLWVSYKNEKGEQRSNVLA